MKLSRADVAEAVRCFHVCWEMRVDFAYDAGQKHRIAFSLELRGAHEEGRVHPAPACTRCRDVYEGLTKIVQYILPRYERPLQYEISSYDQAFHHPPFRKNRPDVNLRITIFRRTDGRQRFGDGPIRWLREMEAHLKDIGATEGLYREQPSPTEINLGGGKRGVYDRAR